MAISRANVTTRIYVPWNLSDETARISTSRDLTGSKPLSWNEDNEHVLSARCYEWYPVCLSLDEMIAEDFTALIGFEADS